MNYLGKKVAITGANGFIGQALATELKNAGAEVYIIDGDIRNRESFNLGTPLGKGFVIPIDHSFDYLFHFAAPSSQINFKRNAAYSIESTLKGLINAADVCLAHGIRLIYPSTGLLSQDKFNEYAMCKKIGEDYIKGLGIDALGIRIFATYGPGEGHKADYASVPYLFARDMVHGKKPIVYGDGEQTRDFIYIADTIYGIMTLAEECFDSIVDLGSGEQVSFNKIIAAINEAMYGPADESHHVHPEYVDAPNGYVKETAAKTERLGNFFTAVITFDEGIALLVNSLVRDKK